VHAIGEVRNMMGSLVSTFPIFLQDSDYLHLGGLYITYRLIEKQKVVVELWNIAQVTIQTEV
jgi:hypothetical protein